MNLLGHGTARHVNHPSTCKRCAPHRLVPSQHQCPFRPIMHAPRSLRMLSKGLQAEAFSEGTDQQQTEQQRQQLDNTPLHPPQPLPWWQRESAANMIDVYSVQQLVDEMAKAGDRLVILDFYAPWCNACRALYPKFVRLMQAHLEDTVFIKINWEENKDIARTLDIKVLPYFQFYRGAEGKVDQFSCTVSKISRFKDALDLFSGEFCSMDDFPGLPEFPDVKPSGSLEENELPTEDAGDANSPTSVRNLWWSD